MILPLGVLVLFQVISSNTVREHPKSSNELSSKTTFINSSSGIRSILFHAADCFVGISERNSILWSWECIIEIEKRDEGGGLACEGEIRAERMRIESDG